MSEIEEEILDNQIYICDLESELKAIREREEDILHQIECYKNELKNPKSFI